MPHLSTAQPSRHSSPTTKAQKLVYLMFECPDLDNAERFLSDFGLRLAQRTPTELYMRSTSTEPFCYRAVLGEKSRFIGFGLAVASRDDLVKLSKFAGASTVMPLTYPGGGETVQLKDPEGFTVEAVWGQSTVQPLTHRPAMELNFDQKTPRINSTQRPPATPPEILRLGHVVIEVADFQDTCAWYTERFGFIPSDVQVLPDGSPAVVFMRMDLGNTPADHHTLAIAQGIMPIYSHSAYEVVDADAVGMGQRVLREHGWTHAWGIGRHILGSQIFDYWQDPWGNKHEHYCDGDVFIADVPMGVHPVSRDAMAQWGPLMPASFTKPKLTRTALTALVKNLYRSPDLNIRKLVSLAKLFG